MADENPNQTEEAPPNQNVVIQMVMGAWVSKALSEVTRLDVPDLLKEHGPRTALQLTERHGVNAVPDILERLLPRISDLAPLTARVYTLTRRSATISPPERGGG